MKLTFLGATETVTGSKYLLMFDQKKILVDCGLFQGLKELRLRNWDAPPLNPKEIDAVILTHAHIDHSGYLPLLVKKGFSGPIFCSHSTADLCTILLPDSGYLQEEEARIANLLGYSKHKPALPLYTKLDAEVALKQFHPVEFGVEYNLGGNVTFQLHRAGHILGASFVAIKFDHSILLFSGDMGRPHDPIMNPPAIMQKADYLVLESTYGDRCHEKTDPAEEIATIINKTVKRGGSVIVPAFAVGRAQLLLYYLHQLKKAKKIANIPVFLDSPMAINATELFCQNAQEHRLSTQQCIDICSDVTYINTAEESTALDDYNSPMIIISASGMATGGRILHHLKAFLPDHRNTVLFTGYQATGTRGDRLVKGETAVKMYGSWVPVRAEIQNLNNMSAHADSDEIIAWLKKFTHPPKKVFLTHGEISAEEALQLRINTELGWTCEIPKYLQTENLS